MFRYSCLFLLLLLSGSSRVLAQQDTVTARQEQQRKAMGMSPAGYREYQGAIKQYGRQLTAVRQDARLGDSAKAQAITRIHAAIKNYQQQYLSADQIERMRAFEQSRPLQTRYQKQQKLHEARMKNAGTHAGRDTLH